MKGNYTAKKFDSPLGKDVAAFTAKISGKTDGGLLDIPLEKIDENPDNEKIFDMGDLDSLEKDMRTSGFKGAIIVLQKNDGRYEISSGHRRFRAAKRIGKDTIPCIVAPYPISDRERGLMLLSSNIYTRKMKPMDWARAIDYYESLPRDSGVTGKSIELAAEYFGISPTSAKRYKRLLKLIPGLQELTGRPEFPYTAFAPALNLSADEQEKLLDLIKDSGGITADDIARIVDDIKNANSPTDENTKEPISNTQQRYADNVLKSSYERLSAFAKTDFSFKDPETAREYISQMKKIIQEIEERALGTVNK